MMPRELSVHFQGGLAGTLQDDGGRLRFQYRAEYLASNGARPLSASLPLRAAPFEDIEARPFFANLLPDGQVRQRIARQLGVSEENDFGLLAELAGECAGAITLLPPGESPARHSSYRPVSREALQEILAELPQRPLLTGETGVRMSMAGAQPKLPVFIDAEGSYHLPLGNAPSTHLLKPEPRDYNGLVDNELFCMHLAGRLQLDVPPAERLDWEFPVYQVRRYDRQPEHKQLLRLHQEDFCQALGIPPERKYEAEGGPDLLRCFRLVEEASSEGAHDMLRLLRWVIFNLVIGNADAHAKNLSLLHAPRPRLAPFYDLVCTAIYPGLARRLAMRIGGEDLWDRVHRGRFERFAQDIGIGMRLVDTELRQLLDTIPAEARQLADKPPHSGRPRVADVVATIEHRAGLVRERCL